MIKQILLSASIATLLLSGCARNDVPEYDGKNYSAIKKYQTGTVIRERPVVISDSGAGKFLGAIIGAVLGTTVGHGDGTTLATLGGGLAGGYAGSEVAKANADELTVELENGEHIVVVVKGSGYQIGDRVQIIKDGNNASQVYKIEAY
jgi:outer membrane lipoprotein SlyB